MNANDNENGTATESTEVEVGEGSLKKTKGTKLGIRWKTSVKAGGNQLQSSHHRAMQTNLR